MTSNYSIGQRWYSQAEPELGLGVVENVADRQVSIHYSAANETRTYNIKSAPLKRHILAVGDEARDEEGNSFEVQDVKEQNAILFYLGANGTVLPETQLKSDISLIKPEEKLLSGNFDPNALFDFRYETTLLKRSLAQYLGRGLEGSRINLIGHQISIFEDVAKKQWPKIVLADEVGLGKTIEAGSLAKRLIERKLVKSVLVIAPKTLQYQWFVELFKKFDLLFKTLGAGDEIELSGKVDNDDLIITNMDVLTGEEGSTDGLANIVQEKPWDLIIVDEAHRYKKGSKEFTSLESLTAKARSAFFLSATPEALGEENFFELLKVLNPQKYGSYEEYLQNEKHYLDQEVTPDLLERYNYERDTFRNRRKNLESHQELFPKKTLVPIPLVIDKPSDRKVIEAKVDGLVELLKKKKDQKIFAIGKSRKLALQVQKSLLEKAHVKVAVFHGEQSLLERDRQAAYFADPEGAQVLISAESGSEGRNFEFASELYLLDFPTHPQLLLQRIGRLDRIGQKNDVTIHSPFVKNSPEEAFFNLYHKAFNLFERFPTGLIEFFEANKEAIERILESGSSEKIEELSAQYKVFQEKVENAKNRFLDAHSYKQENVDEIRAAIKNFHREKNLQSYLEKAFNFVGVDIEELSEQTYFIKPSDNMLIPSYPNLPAEGFSYTISRERALTREDLRFMNFESPIVQGTMELFTQGELGNCSAITHQGKLGENLFMEFIFRVEPKQQFFNDIGTYFPITPVRVLLDASGADLTSKYPKKHIDSLCAKLEESQAAQLAGGLPKQALAQLSAKAKSLATQRAGKYKDQAIAKARAYYDGEITKLEKWGAGNSFTEREKNKLQQAKTSLLEQLEKVSVDLDAVRLIV